LFRLGAKFTAVVVLAATFPGGGCVNDACAKFTLEHTIKHGGSGTLLRCKIIEQTRSVMLRSGAPSTRAGRRNDRRPPGQAQPDIAIDEGAQVELRAGLDPGDRIIFDPPVNLADGTRVQLANPDQPQGAPKEASAEGK
jgi:hypothetical protein